MSKFDYFLISFPTKFVHRVFKLQFMRLIVLTLTSCRCYSMFYIKHFDVGSFLTADKQALQCSRVRALFSCLMENTERVSCMTTWPPALNSPRYGYCSSFLMSCRQTCDAANNHTTADMENQYVANVCLKINYSEKKLRLFETVCY